MGNDRRVRLLHTDLPWVGHIARAWQGASDRGVFHPRLEKVQEPAWRRDFEAEIEALARKCFRDETVIRGSHQWDSKIHNG